MTWYLDTNICIDCLRGKTPILSTYLTELSPQQIKIPSMVKAELLLGAEKSTRPDKNRRLVALFLAPFEIISFDDAAATHYSCIRSDLEKRGRSIGFNDLIIAATVLAHEGILVSGNIREFKRIQGLRLENWTEYSV